MYQSIDVHCRVSQDIGIQPPAIVCMLDCERLTDAAASRSRHAAKRSSSRQPRKNLVNCEEHPPKNKSKYNKMCIAKSVPENL